MRPGQLAGPRAHGRGRAGISLPVFVIAPLLVLVFAVQLHWLPAGDWVAARGAPAAAGPSRWRCPTCAYIARIVRAAALEVLRQPYIRTARAKGLPTHRILLHHACARGSCRWCRFSGPASPG